MSPDQPTNDCTIDAVRAAKPEALGAFESLAQVTGIGITRVGNGYGLKVNLEREPNAGTILPSTIRGVPVRIEVVGKPIKRR